MARKHYVYDLLIFYSHELFVVVINCPVSLFITVPINQCEHWSKL